MTSGGGQMSRDEMTIRSLNEAYIQAFLASDSAWFAAYLSEDFMFTDGRGVVVDRAIYLRLDEAGTDVVDYQLDQVDVRMYGETAVVTALGIFRRRDGTPGKNRYTDVYVRIQNQWRAVSAQVTPVATSLVTA
jgi:ketosteroid isomerase-like protein